MEPCALLRLAVERERLDVLMCRILSLNHNLKSFAAAQLNCCMIEER